MIVELGESRPRSWTLRQLASVSGDLKHIECYADYKDHSGPGYTISLTTLHYI